MNELGKTIVNIMGVVFALLVLGFTGFQTWSLISETTGNPLVATMGLVLFEFGMLRWWFEFQRNASGLAQMGISLVTAVLSLLAVLVATTIHIGAMDLAIDSTLPAKLIVAAAAINLIAEFAYPLFHPDVTEKILQRAIEGRVISAAYAKFQEASNNREATLADQLATSWQNQLEHRILRRNSALGMGDEAPVVINGDELVAVHADQPFAVEEMAEAERPNG